MIKIETILPSPFGFEGAILGMRNPFKNRDKSDSFDPDVNFGDEIGPKDLDLAKRLLASGKDDDSKFMRMIHVQVDITAPLYWWKEFDTYKVATVANSESTMHTIHKHEFTINDFSHDMILDDYTVETDWEYPDVPMETLMNTIESLNMARTLYLKYRDGNNQAKAYDMWYNMIQMLPSSYMQKRTVDLNYQTLRRIYFARRNHKLKEWHEFCDWVETLPYAEDLITYESKRPVKCQIVANKGTANEA